MNFQRIILVAFCGAFGGSLRGLMGVSKTVFNKKTFKMNWIWFFTSLTVSAIVGIIAATFFGDDLRLAVLAGYAGADFIEGLMKIKLKNRFSSESGKESKFGKLLKKAK
jgi:hypothetical protein